MVRRTVHAYVALLLRVLWLGGVMVVLSMLWKSFLPLFGVVVMVLLSLWVLLLLLFQLLWMLLLLLLLL